MLSSRFTMTAFALPRSGTISSADRLPLSGSYARGWHQPITDTANGLHDERIARIALDLAPKPIDLHVDRALTDRFAVSSKRLTRHRLADIGRQYPQHLAFAIGKADRLLAAAQLAAGKMKHKLTEPHGLRRRGGWRIGAPENVRHTQRQFTRLERLRQIIVGADFEAHDPVLFLVARRQHEDRHGRCRTNGARKIET